MDQKHFEDLIQRLRVDAPPASPPSLERQVWRRVRSLRRERSMFWGVNLGVLATGRAAFAILTASVALGSFVSIGTLRERSPVELAVDALDFRSITEPATLDLGNE